MQLSLRDRGGKRSVRGSGIERVDSNGVEYSI